MSNRLENIRTTWCEYAYQPTASLINPASASFKNIDSKCQVFVQLIYEISICMICR